MDRFIELFFSSNSYMPHGNCYLWQPSLLWLQVLSDSIIVLAYYSIPFALWYFVHKRVDLAYRWVFVLFGVFIFLCGSTHLMSIWTIWHADYWLDGWLKMATALVSIATAVLIWPLIPKLLRLPSPEALKTSETFIRAIFDATPDAMLISNAQGEITMVNQQAEHLFGYQADELMGLPIDILVSEKFRTGNFSSPYLFVTLPHIRSLGAGRIVLAQKKDRSEFAVDISLSPIETERGQFYASAFRDVTLQQQAENALRLSEERFRRMADASPALIWITDINGNPSFVNKTWLNFTGLSFAQALSYNGWLDLIHPDDKQTVFTEYYKNIQDRKSILTEYRMLCAKGNWRWILDQGVPLHDDNGEFSGYVGSAIDITERKLAEAEFRIAATAFESQEAMVITDVNTVILRVNKTFTDTTGYSAEEAVGQKMNLLKSGYHDDQFYQAMWDCVNRSGNWQGEVWDKRKNGEIYPKILTITAVKDTEDRVTHYVGTHIDISERKAAEDEIKHLAFYDPLTKLPNRRLLLNRLQQALSNYVRRGLYGALLFIDLDNFKTLNDTLGHDMGDLLLKQVGLRLTSSVRECDTVARLGGDEFVIMLEFLNERSADAAIQAEQVAEKIILTLSQPYHLNKFEYQCTSSIGATLFSEQDNTIEELLKQADIAMYQAKAAGRNTVRFFDPSMQAAVTARADLEKELRRALKRKEFLVYYQPQVNEKGVIIGLEALVRWLHPQCGLISPIDFIPLAEETGLILPLGQWVFDTVCAQLVVWANQPAFAHLTIAVNVSVRQFRQKDFVDQVMASIHASGVNPEKLKIELTETLLVSDVQDIINKMKQLKQQGVVFSLDDFGTGYSSLFYLKQLPLDQLKIDQSFVKDIQTDTNIAAIAKMIIVLADSMGLHVIAEGVEKQDQRDYLMSQGCQEFQGYLYGKPMPIHEFETLFSHAGQAS